MNQPSVMGVAAHCDDIEFLFAGTLLKYHEKYGYHVCYVESTNNMAGGWAINADGKPELPSGDYNKVKKEVFPERFCSKFVKRIHRPQCKGCL